MNPTPDRIDEIVIDGLSLGIEQVVAVARYRARVQLSDAARRRIRMARDVVEKLVEARAKVYGLTTGFGSKRDTSIDPHELEQLQVNLIRSHACGVGDPLGEDEVRAAMLLRANTLARGNSGIRLEVVEALLEFLNRDVYPWLPSRGSLGASGDLAPLSHLALALCNDEGARFYRRDPEQPNSPGPVTPGGRRPDFVARPVPWRFGGTPAGLFDGAGGMTPVVLKAKEGLALNNGTQVSTAIGILAVFDAHVLVESAELVCGLSLEATKGVRAALDLRLHEARPLVGQREVAGRLRAYTDASQILNLPINTARLHRAQKSVVAARELLLAHGGKVGTEFSEEAREIQEELSRFEEHAVATLEEGRRLADARECAELTDSALSIRIYRDALAGIRSRVLAFYAAILEEPLEGEARKSRDQLADAVAQLQLALPETPSVQDDYSFRCTPQVLGAVSKTVLDTRRVLEIEANSATDNPLIFPPAADSYEGPTEDYAATLTLRGCMEAVVSGGNFHGEAIAFAMDYLTIALAELGSISERRTAHLVDGALSNGLPSLLVERSGLNNGLMIPQYVAAGLVSENKVLSHPASVDSIPTSENTEDHVSMSPIAALKCRQVLGNVETVVAIELLTAWQGVYFRRPLTCGRATEILWRMLEDEGMKPVLTDRVLYLDIEWMRSALKEGRIWNVAREHRNPVVD